MVAGGCGGKPRDAGLHHRTHGELKAVLARRVLGASGLTLITVSTAQAPVHDRKPGNGRAIRRGTN